MATVEHCLCCFEALAAYHERRKPMSLSEIEKSWAEYINTIDDDGDEADNKEEAAPVASKTPQIPALRRLAEASASSSSSSSASLSTNSSAGSASSSSNTTLQSGISTPATSVSASPAPAQVHESPLFVTWNVVRRSSDDDDDDDDDEDDDVHLRGCIGTFEAQPLSSGLPSYALTSALQDTRFPPISRAELNPSLQVAVTLLTDFEPAADAMDWELGRHGLRISFVYRGRRYGATYLPDVAPEQGWTKEETVLSLMRKAGWLGDKSRWREVELRVVRYQGKKEKLMYEEYKAWRDWVDGKTAE
ncbi:AMMECR1 domain-containing protein [Sordaria brevicollis]|uniref:AMMECR1 domain-containing protein n=1 Tax=Sordaria brevicollis TaxID=83679 RepID=A0AAE0P1B1_SORBR|nr:AMMECR1 domain-containing protein [Sordaria brevicollis]